MKTEKEMRDEAVPTFETLEELNKYITQLKEQEHDYGTAVYAISMAATAAFNYMAASLGATGFQASCADLDILRRTRYIKAPFAIITAEDMLYPQYNIDNKFKELKEGWKPWAKEEAKKLLLSGDTMLVAPKVLEHWLNLAYDEYEALDLVNEEFLK